MAKEPKWISINNESRYEDFRKKLIEIADKPSNWLNQTYRGSSHPVCGDKRFYVSPKKYSILREGTSDESLGVELVELSTKKRYIFNPACLLNFSGVDLDGRYFEAKSLAIINRMLYERVKDVKPYITNKEFVDAFLRIVGDRHFYFKATRHIGLTPWGKRQCKYTLDCIFVKMPV
jgi:hypothetical protein